MFKAINTTNPSYIKSIQSEKKRISTFYTKFLKTKKIESTNFISSHIENKWFVDSIKQYIFYNQVKHMNEYELLNALKTNITSETPCLMALILEKAIGKCNFGQASVVLKYCVGKGIVSWKIVQLERVHRMRRHVGVKCKLVSILEWLYYGICMLWDLIIMGLFLCTLIN